MAPTRYRHSLTPDIADDYLCFDGLEEITLTQSVTPSDASNPSLDTTTGIITPNEVDIVIPHALRRQISQRNVGSVRQIFERGKSVTQDEISLADTIFEVPIAELSQITINARVVDASGQKY